MTTTTHQWFHWFRWSKFFTITHPTIPIFVFGTNTKSMVPTSFQFHHGNEVRQTSQMFFSFSFQHCKCFFGFSFSGHVLNFCCCQITQLFDDIPIDARCPIEQQCFGPCLYLANGDHFIFQFIKNNKIFHFNGGFVQLVQYCMTVSVPTTVPCFSFGGHNFRKTLYFVGSHTSSAQHAGSQFGFHSSCLALNHCRGLVNSGQSISHFQRSQIITPCYKHAYYVAHFGRCFVLNDLFSPIPSCKFKTIFALYFDHKCILFSVHQHFTMCGNNNLFHSI